MDNPTFNILQTERCDNLRWKGMFIDLEADPYSGDHIFWCVKTQIGLGPDGAPVGNYDCNPSRGCYKAL